MFSYHKIPKLSNPNIQNMPKYPYQKYPNLSNKISNLSEFVLKIFQFVRISGKKYLVFVIPLFVRASLDPARFSGGIVKEDRNTYSTNNK